VNPEVGGLLTASESAGVLPLTSRCNLACVFCSNRFNPPGVQVALIEPRGLDEVRRALPRLSRATRLVVGESATRVVEGEPFAHPDLLPALEAVRRACPEAPLVLTTNGTLLDREAARRLADLAPLEVNLSLNAIDVALRHRVLGDGTAADGTAARAAALLAEAGVPCHGSIVPWGPLSDAASLEPTVRHLAGCAVRTVRLLSPAFTAAAPPGVRRAVPDPRVLRLRAAALQADHGLPVIVEPPRLEDLEPQVAGLIPGSPAARAGLRPGDIIRRVGGRTVFSRHHAYSLIAAAGLPLKLEVERAGGRLRCTIRAPALAHGHDPMPPAAGECDPVPPPAPKTKMAASLPGAHGLVFEADLPPEDWARLLRRARRRDLRRLVVCASVPAAPLLRAAADRESGGLEIEVLPVPNLTFGGSIACSGLLTVADLLAALDQAGFSPDPRVGVAVPARPWDAAGRDITGRGRDELAARVGGRLLVGG